MTLLGPLPGLPAPALTLTDAQRAMPGCVDAALRYAQPFDVSGPGPLPGALVAVEATDHEPGTPRDRRMTFRDCDVQPRVLFVSQNDRVYFHSDAHRPVLPHVRGTGNPIDQLIIPGANDVLITLPRRGEYPVNVQGMPPFVGAMIMVLPNRHIATTDGQGHFRLDEVPVGEHTINAWFIATQASRARVTVRPGEVTRVDLTLRYTPPPPRPAASDAGGADAEQGYL